MKTLTGTEAYGPAAELLAEYVAEVARRIDGFDAGAVDVAAEARDGTMTVVCADDGTPLGCLAVRVIAPGVAEVKRMYVRPAARGAGLGGRLITLAERAAAGLGATTLRLDTAGDSLPEAYRLYRRHGFTEVPRYNDNPNATHWLEKRVPLPDTAMNRA